MQSTRRRRTGGRRFFPRRKVCYFSAENKSPDYKDVPILRRFVSEWGKIDSRRRTGTRSRHQRKLAVAIKRARFLALLPYTGGHSQIELGRPDRGDRNRRFTPRDGSNNRFNSYANNNDSPSRTVNEVEAPAPNSLETTEVSLETADTVSVSSDETSVSSQTESANEQPEE
ncbi:MAG: 30S ribosomal protein S18 [SAR202 cluster bacterium]|nr:30S ribosomal protein S18 [SAR202 cluster bacterium]|tara:strand:- start:33566 stop:34078 length:513 start_codon:yes stop_codon:yes gene_type:complete